jgi:hypothetical protein
MIRGDAIHVTGLLRDAAEEVATTDDDGDPDSRTSAISVLIW